MSLAKRFLAFLGWRLGIGPLLRVFYEPRELALAYHTIGDSSQKYAHINTSLDAFKDHMNYLKKRGYSFHRFSDAVEPGVGKRAYIYFDDGFRAVRDNVLPYLRERNIPATLFVTVEYIENGDSEYLRWDDIRKMTDVFELGSHGLRHVKLNKIPVKEVEANMLSSKEIIERNTGARISAFSYPKGRSSADLEKAARSSGFAITTADKRFHKVRPDPEDSTAFFKWKTIL